VLPEAVALALATPEKKRSAAERARVAAHYRELAPELAAFRVETKPVEEALAALDRDVVRTPVMRELPPEKRRTTHVLLKSNWLAPGDVVEPDTPRAFPPLPAGAPKNRLSVARWLVSPENPLTARVMVNRVWQWHFGKGLVRSVDNFGLIGEKPTHPELLDYLATELMDGGWDLKKLHKRIVLSATYRQASANHPGDASIDNESRFLWRYPPRRLEAEEMLDSILAVSGKLNRTMGGPGFRLYNYTVDNVATYYPLESFEPSTFRRAVYYQTARSVKDDLMSLYDCPDSTSPDPKRVVTTTALQALSLLNSTFIIGQAKFFAERLIRETSEGDVQSQAIQGFQLAFGRRPTTIELNKAVEFIRHNGLMAFCRILFNANEFVYVIEIFLVNRFAERCLDFPRHDKLLFRHRSQNQIAQPIRVRDPFAIGSQCFDRRIHTQIAVRSIGVLPALVPVNCGFDARKTRAKQLKSLRYPLGLANAAAISRVWKFAGCPFGNHDRFMRIESGDFLVGPVYQ
jgi:hypothetical protein